MIIVILVIIKLCLFSSCADVAFEQDYCGWKVVKWQYSAVPGIDCHGFIVEKDRKRKKIYVMPDVARKYGVSDIICKTQR